MEKEKIFNKIIITGILVIYLFLSGCLEYKQMTPTPLPVQNTPAPTPVKYSIEAQTIEEDYSKLINKVQENIKKAKTADQQQAVSSYYTIEAMELIQKQNNLIIKQNDKIIELLTEIRDKK